MADLFDCFSVFELPTYFLPIFWLQYVVQTFKNLDLTILLHMSACLPDTNIRNPTQPVNVASASPSYLCRIFIFYESHCHEFIYLHVWRNPILGSVKYVIDFGLVYKGVGLDVIAITPTLFPELANVGRTVGYRVTRWVCEQMTNHLKI
jgi:hypothetical protein